MHPTLHPSSLPQIGDRVQVKQGVYARRVFIVIGAYSDQVELGDEDGNFVYSCSLTIVTVCSSPATQTAPASLPAPADAGQGVGIPYPCTPLTVLAFVSPCGNWRRVDDRAEQGVAPLWGVINTREDRRA